MKNFVMILFLFAAISVALTACGRDGDPLRPNVNEQTKENPRKVNKDTIRHAGRRALQRPFILDRLLD